MSESPPHPSAADFGIDALARKANRRLANTSLLGIASAIADTRSPAGSYSPAYASHIGQPAAGRPRRVQQQTKVALSSPETEPVATVTLEKIGDFLELDFRRLFVWLRAGLKAALVLALAGALAGGFYGLTAKKRYTVATDIMINPANLQVMDNDLYAQSSQVDSQVLNARSKQRVLTSRNVLSHVVDELNLADDPEFAPGAIARSGTASDAKLAAVAKLQDSVKTEADEHSFVTTLSVSAETADKAIEISQAIVKTFQEELAKSEAEGASRAAAALDGRLRQLKADVLEAEKKVEAYRRDHKLSSSNGQLVSSQAMTQLNSQIVEAQARATAAQASYDTLVAGGVNGNNASPTVSGTLADLRDKANSLRQDLNSQSVQLGPRHPLILKLRAELDTVNTQVKAEYQHTVEAAKASRDAAKISLDSLVAKMNNLQGDVFTDNDSEVGLRELERDAASKTAIYERFLSRTRQMSEREQIDTTNVQVISAAVPPKGRSWPPRTMLLVALGAFGGFAFGMMLSIAWGIRQDLRLQPNDPRRSPA
ncbi:GumC family protein [Mesorhizobium sp. BAC0120]|uniref:GumC family protein n=1 Tax=Mesorhizobium sp. BAC0120 TaxID=3090670 RepID=UPI00298C10BE|nr:GumC family protein [Mesorhizobium sp. BAC0120]MDW6022421.1 GumC family protein [Mesorhizobium sp. BAC0120]